MEGSFSGSRKLARSRARARIAVAAPLRILGPRIEALAAGIPGAGTPGQTGVDVYLTVGRRVRLTVFACNTIVF